LLDAALANLALFERKTTRWKTISRRSAHERSRPPLGGNGYGAVGLMSLPMLRGKPLAKNGVTKNGVMRRMAENGVRSWAENGVKRMGSGLVFCTREWGQVLSFANQPSGKRKSVNTRPDSLILDPLILRGGAGPTSASRARGRCWSKCWPGCRKGRRRCCRRTGSTPRRPCSPGSMPTDGATGSG